MLVPLKGSWALIFGVSSGMGRATARALAAEGCNVIGVHLDLADGQEAADELAAELRERGVQAHFFNRNVAARETRAELLPAIRELTGEVRIVLHSVAFGSLVPFVPTGDAPKTVTPKTVTSKTVTSKTVTPKTVTPKQLAMTVDVMAHSLVYWTQDLLAAGLLPRGAKVYALTSAGGTRALRSYGAVSAAKAALESHVRQLAVELAPYEIAVNAIRAGTTITPALQKIPNSAQVADRARAMNPHGRLTTTEDVAEAIVLLSATDSSWITGNVIGVDGGEAVVA